MGRLGTGFSVIALLLLLAATQGPPVYVQLGPNPDAGLGCTGDHVLVTNTNPAQTWCCIHADGGAGYWANCSVPNRVGFLLNNGSWCTTDGTLVNCSALAPAAPGTCSGKNPLVTGTTASGVTCGNLLSGCANGQSLTWNGDAGMWGCR